MLIIYGNKIYIGDKNVTNEYIAQLICKIKDKIRNIIKRFLI